MKNILYTRYLLYSIYIPNVISIGYIMYKYSKYLNTFNQNLKLN